VRSGDSRADNLISRLFSYSPRRNRQSLEDYCTEALAWCLRTSSELFPEIFAETELKSLTRRSDTVDIHTQLPFKTSDQRDEESEAPEDQSGGRFDLVIESGLPDPFVLVIESKIGSDFGPAQLEKYRSELTVPESFPGVPRGSRFLVTLTTVRNHSELVNANITWPQIHRAISSSMKSENDLIAGLRNQFASFLNEKGLSMLELNKTDDKLLSQWFDVKKLEDQLKRIIERLRNQEEVKPIVGRRQVRQDGNDWIGVYGKNDFWAGFGIFRQGGSSEIALWVEITVLGDRSKFVEHFDADMKAAFKAAKKYLNFYPDDPAINCGTRRGNTSRFVFATPLAGALDGSGEAVFDWLYRASKKAITLAGKTASRP